LPRRTRADRTDRRRRGSDRAAPPRRPRSRRALRWLLVGAGFAAGFLAGAELVRLDRIVTARFEGPRFRVPSRVLSAPTILYPGLDWQRIGLRELLGRLGYREEPAGALRARALPPGTGVWSRNDARIHLRGFEHPTRPEPARDVRLRFEGSRIESLEDAGTGRSLGAVLLEPELVGAYYGPDREQRDLVRLADLPPHLVHAVLAVEDQRFQTHHGIDFRRIIGALMANLRAGAIREGGSTLTQQLAKNFFLTPDRTLRRKLEEAAIALLIEARYDKPEILEAYLNEIYLGQRGSTEVHGVGEASRLYFGKPARELGLAEAALIAAIIKSPNGTSPFREPERALARRNLVLDLMREQGRIDDAAWRAASAEPLRLARRTTELREARFFLDALRRQLPEVYDNETLTAEGLRIYSTLDLRLQRLAAEVLAEGIEDLEKRFPKLRRTADSEKLQGCLVALRPQTGEVLALVGGRSYGVSQFDRCTQARRPAGSAFKPFVYAAALEPRGGRPEITLVSRLEDTPLRLQQPSGPWEPANFDKEFHGSVGVRQAVERSLNVATARLALDVGIERVADVARRLGITSPLPLVPSLALGVADVSPLELARAYATLANGGIRPQIRTFDDLVDASGRTVARAEIDFERVLDAGTAYLVTSLLEGAVDRGTGAGVRRAGIEGPVAGKTGTTDDERDVWFAGFTPELVVVVWLGFDEPRSLGIPAGAAAVPVWARFVREATGGRVRGVFPRPPEVVELEVDPSSGAIAKAGCPVHQPEYFLAGTEPTRTCPPGWEPGERRWEAEVERGTERLRDSLLRWLRGVL
jgi:penicillin-binding protein 1B